MSRNSANCASTMTPLATRPARRPGRAADSSRCTRNWSVPCVARVSATPAEHARPAACTRASCRATKSSTRTCPPPARRKHLVPSTRNAPSSATATAAGPDHVDEHLDDVRPDDGRRATAGRIDDHCTPMHEHRAAARPGRTGSQPDRGIDTGHAPERRPAQPWRTAGSRRERCASAGTGRGHVLHRGPKRRRAARRT